jgi:hypothetical protein
MITDLVRIADAQRAEVRLAHLAAHVDMKMLLDDGQVRRYRAARGYN